jgi:hypothetical protein
VRAKQVTFREGQLAHKPVEKFSVAFQLAIRENVLNSQSEKRKMAGYQNTAVAFHRFLFGAHQGEPMFPHSFLDAIEAPPEQLSQRESVVLNTTAIVTGWILTACSQFVAEKNVSDANVMKLRLQALPIELRTYAAVRPGSHVSERSDVMQLEQRNEGFQTVRGMSDCENRLLHGFTHSGCSLMIEATSLWHLPSPSYASVRLTHR